MVDDEDEYDDDGSDLAGLLDQMRELNESGSENPGPSGSTSELGPIEEARVVEADVYVVPEDDDEGEGNQALQDIDSQASTSGAAATPSPFRATPVASPCRLSSHLTKGFVDESPRSSHFLSRALVLTQYSKCVCVCVCMCVCVCVCFSDSPKARIERPSLHAWPFSRPNFRSDLAASCVCLILRSRVYIHLCVIATARMRDEKASVATSLAGLGSLSNVQARFPGL